MEKNKIVVVGSANTDLVICGDHFPQPGETMIGHGFMVNRGGKGANQAVAAARLGAPTAFVCKLGSDSFGRDTQSSLLAEGITLSRGCFTDEAPTGVAMITTIDSGENNIIIDAGANWRLTSGDIVANEALFAEAAVVLMQLETPVETVAKAAELAKKHGAYVVLNPAPAPTRPLPAELLRNVDLLIPNEGEASAICGCEINDANIAEGFERLRSMGVGDAIITVGSKGAFACIDGKPVLVPAFKVKAVDTTAAGDTFCGAICVARCRGYQKARAVEFANRAASISVTRRGAQMSMPRLEEIEIS